MKLANSSVTKGYNLVKLASMKVMWGNILDSLDCTLVMQVNT